MLHRLILLRDADDLVLCSGYIWEPAAGYKYKILDDKLLDVLLRGCKGKRIITIAGKLDKQWLDHYKNFVRRLRQKDLYVKPYLAPKRNWHAKIAIRLKQGKPIAAIIGSSNLTGPAYSENGYSWNFECDVLIWENSSRLNQLFKQPFEKMWHLEIFS
ncbi:MAG: phospholipase D-like domain-containing protein [Oscillochloridaceae bacterium]|nr:phospholipase D-like domain-containing protein [Chloroflexaceae bacterium]MDW8390725.1 phospholipase D-like domain-containing protein [Oscillochloridaceae bacterium]